jgi:hypothetical protein
MHDDEYKTDYGYLSDDDRADQPPSEETTCPTMPPNNPPDAYEPPECKKTPDCNCPDPPGATEHCLETLIEKQTGQVTVAEKAKAFKAELEALLTKAKAASQEYTAEKYAKLVKQWEEQDAQIAALIHTLVCKYPCWRCIIECYVCPLLDDMRKAEQYLLGDGNLCREMHSIYDLRYWHERNKEARDRVFQRIKSVLAVWEKPAQTIEKILADNAKLIADGQTITPATVYDVFLKLVPMHLAIAPPTTVKKTKIAKKFTFFCECDQGCPENCCGPDVGESKLRDRLIGPQPYLIKPENYFKIICCLVEHLYLPAKDLLAEATAALEKVENEIKRYKAQLENGFKDFEKRAKARIPNPVECCGPKLCKPKTQQNQTAG